MAGEGNTTLIMLLRLCRKSGMRGWALGIAWILIGAGGASGQDADPLDTASVRRLGVAELARVGGDDLREGYLFERVRDAVVLGPDAFVILDGGSSEALTYGIDGILRGKVGGEGQGPGEFGSARRLSALSGARLMVWDSQLQRATVFGPDGTVESTASVDLGPMAGFFSGFVAALPDGSWIQRVDRNPLELRDEPEGTRRDTLVFRHVSADGNLLDPVAAVLGPRRILVKYGPTSWAPEPPILGRDLISVLKGDTLLLGLTDSLRILRFTADGPPLPPLRLPRPERTAGRRLADAVRAELVAEAEGAGARPRGASLPGLAAFQRGRIESLKRMPAEETVPAFAGLLVGADGSLWVREYRLPNEPKAERWFRMGPDFRPDGWLDVPESGRLLAAGYGLLVTVVKDDLDVESVVVHRVG